MGIPWHEFPLSIFLMHSAAQPTNRGGRPTGLAETCRTLRKNYNLEAKKENTHRRSACARSREGLWATWATRATRATWASKAHEGPPRVSLRNCEGATQGQSVLKQPWLQTSKWRATEARIRTCFQVHSPLQKSTRQPRHETPPNPARRAWSRLSCPWQHYGSKSCSECLL